MNLLRKKAIIATIFAAVLWSSGGLFIKLLPLDSFLILFYRSLFSALFFLFLFGKNLFRFNRLMIISTLFYAPLLICFVTSTKLTTAANAIFLQYTAPAFVLLLEPLLLKTKLLKINTFTVIICFMGMGLFFLDSISSPDNWLGIGLGAISGLMLTGLIITQKMNNENFHVPAVFWGNILVCIITLPWFINSPVPDSISISYLVFLGCGQLGLGYILFFYGQRSIPAIESSLIAMLEPILNPVWVLIGYGEYPGYWSLAGGSVIIAALAFRLIWLEFKGKPALLGRNVDG
ncbi:MAG: DMT family transporter [Saprospiraceae bacterium]|nr:DMT family transporter [Saprospiraceae bacterium]